MDRLYVHERGDRGQPAVVFLHGAAVSGRMWRDHMAQLAGYHCLAPDLPGHGRSNGLAWHSRLKTADIVARVIEDHVPARRAHLVGLSLGGSVAHALVERRADLVDRVIIDGCGALPWRGELPFRVLLAAIAPLLHTRPVIWGIGRALGALSDADRADIRAVSRGAFLRAWIDANATRITPAEVAADCPTLFVAGERETFVRPSNAALASLMMGGAARFVPGAGHGWMATKPDLHVAMVEAWLAGLALPDGLAVETVPWPRELVERLLVEGEPLDVGRRNFSRV